jgi:hypothetical protein
MHPTPRLPPVISTVCRVDRVEQPGALVFRVQADIHRGPDLKFCSRM